jgi:hypothetical protein
MIVQLDDNMWLGGNQKPPKTTIKEFAETFDTMKEATQALEEARKYEPFKNALLIFEKGVDFDIEEEEKDDTDK